jgi:hypothetical protein
MTSPYFGAGKTEVFSGKTSVFSGKYFTDADIAYEEIHNKLAFII